MLPGLYNQVTGRVLGEAWARNVSDVSWKRVFTCLDGPSSESGEVISILS